MSNCNSVGTATANVLHTVRTVFENAAPALERAIHTSADDKTKKARYSVQARENEESYDNLSLGEMLTSIAFSFRHCIERLHFATFI